MSRRVPSDLGLENRATLSFRGSVSQEELLARRSDFGFRSLPLHSQRLRTDVSTSDLIFPKAGSKTTIRIKMPCPASRPLRSAFYFFFLRKCLLAVALMEPFQNCGVNHPAVPALNKPFVLQFRSEHFNKCSVSYQFPD